jgi:phage terminase large subunit-like protein
MIRREWLRYYDNLPERTDRAKILQSWDTAAKDGAQNDFSTIERKSLACLAGET